MQKSMIKRLEPLLFLLIGVIFFCVGGKYGRRVFMIWGIVSLVFAAAVFLIHTFSKRKTENAFVPLYLLFVGCLVMCGGLFALRDKLLILVGGVFMIIGVLSGFLFSSEERRREDERFRKGIRLPDEYIILFAAMENRENEDLKWYVINKETGTPYVFCKGKYNLTDFGTIKTLACSKYARCFMVDEMKKRSFWADFSEDNWWKKLKIKFDKTQSKKEKIEKLSRKIVTANLKDGIRYIFGRFLWERARACFPDEPHCDFVELMMDLKERKIIANIASYDGRRDYEITMTADEMHEIAINNGIGDIVFMEKEDDWKTLFDNCEEHLRSINEGSTASSVKPPLLSKKKVDVDVEENRYRVLERTVNTEAKQKLLEAIRKEELEKFLMAAPGYRLETTDRNFPEMNDYSRQFEALNEYGKSNRGFENDLIQALRNCLKKKDKFGVAYHIVRIICEQVQYEKRGKNSMSFIGDDLLKELREVILLNKEKLMDYKEWDGKLYEDGMYGALKYHCDFISTVSGDKYKIL